MTWVPLRITTAWPAGPDSVALPGPELSSFRPSCTNTMVGRVTTTCIARVAESAT